MRGAVAAGHPLTAQAGARILAEGGNAVDACVAAGFAAWVTESPLTGPGAGGFMLVHRAADGKARLLDFFVTVPGRGLDPGEGGEMEVVEISFDEQTTQPFSIGAPSCAVPGSVAGLAEAHRLYGSLPWRRLLEPALELAQGGVELTAEQAFLHRILDRVLRAAPEGRALYGRQQGLGVGERLLLPDLAATLGLLAEEGARGFYMGELARRLSETVRAAAGRLTPDDLAAYRVIRRRPIRVRYRGHELVTNPPPSSGGVLIAFALSLLERLGAGRTGTAAAVATLAEVMRETTRARATAGFAPSLRRGGLAARLLAPARLDEAALRTGAGLDLPAREPVGAPSTTHVSVVDAAGNAASLSTSTGCGSGVVVPGTGIHLNNMLGEEDLNPAGGSSRPGRRLTSMMAPSLVLRDGRPRVVVGSAGSVRLRGAILQIIVNVIGHGQSVEQAIEAPRVHLDGEQLHLEPGLAATTVRELVAAGYELVRWPERNLYFGGAAAVAVGAGGQLEAAGDPRRGGAGVVVG